MNRKDLKNFGRLSFNKRAMKENLPYPIYIKWKEAARNNLPLDLEIADSIAHGMKEWALRNGARSYTHWFQPLNGLTAHKRLSFLKRTDKNNPINRFSGKELIKGEPDASSFPNGGMRSTFEARGYTYWDLTSNSFILDDVLYIPSVFVSYRGEKLDKKYPVLESMNIVSKEASRLANIFLKDQYTYRVRPKVGLEQEFFLIEKKLFDKRVDLINTGMTMIGSNDLIEQEVLGHYLGAIPQRVDEFFKDVNEILFDLGIYVEAEHNEAAPNQFEIATSYENCNIAIDYNQLLMYILQRVALKHDLVCLLKEKPFKGINGSGKHNNYSLLTNYGLNFFAPGTTKAQNKIFLLTITAMIEACDKYQNLIRIASSSVTNDYRLGGNEAPPSIISVFLGDNLEKALKAIAYDDYTFHEVINKLKVPNIGQIQTDSSDRNRTSPIAYTGNKFEFRMLGSSNSAADLNIIINLAMAESFRHMADVLEKTREDELDEKVNEIIRDIYLKHSKILFSGDGYSKAWVKEAENRGLKNLPSLLDALLDAQKTGSYDLYQREGIFSQTEIKAIHSIKLKQIADYASIQLKTLRNILEQDLVSSAIKEMEDLAKYLNFMPNTQLKAKAEEINQGLLQILSYEKEIDPILSKACEIEDICDKAIFIQEKTRDLISVVRVLADEMEKIISKRNFSLPTYQEMLKSL
ncbi:MAG: glutamine synthetase III [Peptoniphilaceae bacterium]|nr:glutamine synthetase III [Peptoniphilaceae bacterium]MDY6018103.1 glutamine synthetase III [Anaerococcus sp.]